MHREIELRYENEYRNTELRELINTFIELNHQYRIAIVAFLLHPNPPNRDSDLRYLAFIKRKVEIINEIIKEKQR